MTFHSCMAKSNKGDPGVLILTPSYEFIIALLLHTQQPPCPTSPIRIFASLGVVSLFRLSLPSAEMKEKVKPLEVLRYPSSNHLLGTSAFTAWLLDLPVRT